MKTAHGYTAIFRESMPTGYAVGCGAIRHCIAICIRIGNADAARQYTRDLTRVVRRATS